MASVGQQGMGTYVSIKNERMYQTYPELRFDDAAVFTLGEVPSPCGEEGEKGREGKDRFRQKVCQTIWPISRLVLAIFASVSLLVGNTRKVTRMPTC